MNKIMVLDVGGTAIKAAICRDGVLEDMREYPTDAVKGGAHVTERICDIIREYKKKWEFARIGLSTTGQVDPVKGSIIYANNNIPGYTGTPLKDILEETFGVPAEVENDVNAAAIGEAFFGAGRGEREFACLTYGTGVGGAIFARGELYGGSSCSAGEFGAMILHPEDRRAQEDMYSGCYEKYASTTALTARARAFDPALENGRLIFARMEEPEVKRIIDEWIMEIVNGLITVVHMLNPSCVILGGGVMEQPYVLEQVREKLRENIMPSFRHVKVRRAELGNRAGLLGASVLQELHSNRQFMR